LTTRVVPDRAEYLRRWSALHQGHDPGATPFVTGWLSLVHFLAAPLARAGIRPDTVTIAGALLSVLAPVAAVSRVFGVPPAAAAFAAAVLVFVSGIGDNIDGAVAALTGTSSRWGYVLDSVCDRIADVAYLLGLWALGAPGPLVAAGGVLTGFQEYARARGIAGGMVEIGVVTIAERPTRVLVAGMFCVAAAVLPGAGDHRIAVWVTVGGAVWAGAHAVGLVQVLRALRRALR
jgi:phosphatidylglycerophosphate synthase